MLGDSIDSVCLIGLCSNDLGVGVISRLTLVVAGVEANVELSRCSSCQGGRCDDEVHPLFDLHEGFFLALIAASAAAARAGFPVNCGNKAERFVLELVMPCTISERLGGLVTSKKLTILPCTVACWPLNTATVMMPREAS